MFAYHCLFLAAMLLQPTKTSPTIYHKTIKKYGLRMSCIKAKSLASVICITRCLLDGGFLLPIQSYSRNSKTMGCHEHMEKTTVLMSLYVLTAEVHLFRKAKFSHGLTTKTEAVVATVELGSEEATYLEGHVTVSTPSGTNTAHYRVNK